MPLVDPPLQHLAGTVRQIAVLMSSTGFTEIPTRINTGLYVTCHFNFEHHLAVQADNWPSLRGIPFPMDCVGVCDEPMSWYRDYGYVLDAHFPGREFVVSFTRVAREDQAEHGGWRWSKWGPYVGKHTPQAEYLYDEADISVVYTFHIYEVIK